MPYGNSENIKDTFFSLWPATEETPNVWTHSGADSFSSDLATVSKVKKTQDKQCDLEKKVRLGKSLQSKVRPETITSRIFCSKKQKHLPQPKNPK